MEVALEVSGLAWDERVAAAEVSGLSGLTANLHPHVTLARGTMVPPRVSNELLARKAAGVDMQTGLAPWLQQLGLAQYAEALREWCLQMGAATPEEIAENAADAAAAVEVQSEEQRRRVEEVLARAAHGEVRAAPLGGDVARPAGTRVAGHRRRGEPPVDR